MAQTAQSNHRAHWSKDLEQDYEANKMSGIVGSTLVSETDDVRVWHLLIPAGKRCSFHRHVLNYFWTCHSHGRAMNIFEDGTTREVTHFPGDTRHLNFGAGEYMVHAVQNTGTTDLLFTTVEFKNSPNKPLDIPEGVRLVVPKAA